jgi:hypothetical protein
LKNDIEFRGQIGHGEFSDVADFIVREFLTEELEIDTSQVGALSEVTEQPVRLPPPDFEVVAQTVYNRVMADTNFAYHLQFAQSRGALRNPLNTVLDTVMADMQKAEPAVYGDYFNDDIADNLFDFVYKTAWANRPGQQQEAVTGDPTTDGIFYEITDPAVIAEVEAIFGDTNAAQSNNKPIMIIDQAARQNFNLFALTFPRIADGTYQSARYKDDNNDTLSIWFQNTNAGHISVEITHYTSEGLWQAEPTMTLRANFEQRMLTPLNYANSHTGEDIALLTLPMADSEEETHILTLKLADLLTNIRSRTWTLQENDVFLDSDGKELPATPKPNLDEFLKERADRKTKAQGEVQRLMFYSPENEQESESNIPKSTLPNFRITDNHIGEGDIYR